MQRRLACALTFAVVCGFPSLAAASDELNQRLVRIFHSDALSGKRFGPARWIRGGAAFTIRLWGARTPLASGRIRFPQSQVHRCNERFVLTNTT